jgi:hypothetical protein
MGSGLDDWIYWHFFTSTLSYDSSQSMALSDSLHSLLDHERLLFCVSDLVLSHESVTSSLSVVHWLTIHGRTLKFWILLRLNHWTPLWMLKDWTLLNWTSRRPEYRSPSRTVRVILFFSCTKRVYRTAAQQWVIPCPFFAAGTCVRRALD